jgi:hypothetical protein
MLTAILYSAAYAMVLMVLRNLISAMPNRIAPMTGQHEKLRPDYVEIGAA